MVGTAWKKTRKLKSGKSKLVLHYSSTGKYCVSAGVFMFYFVVYIVLLIGCRNY